MNSKPGKCNIEELLYPVNGYRGTLEKKGISLKNHQATNKKLLKAKHEEFLAKQEKIEEAKKESICVGSS